MQSTRMVAFIMNELTDYSIELSVGAQSVLTAHGYQCMAITGKHLDDATSEAYHLIYQALHADRFAGAILHTFTLENCVTPTKLPMILAPLTHLAIVSIGAQLSGYRSIVANQEAGMAALMNHLVAQTRYQRFLFVRGLPTNADSLLREKIFREYLQQQDRLAQAEFITGYYDGDLVYKEIYTWCLTAAKSSATLPTAIVCANDRMAVAAIEAVQDAGLHVPDDVAVTGFDNSRECENSKVPLTTVGQPLVTMGEQAAEMLLEQLAGRPVADRALPTQLIIRASSGDAADAALTAGLPLSPIPQATPQLLNPALKRRDYLSHLITNLNIKLMEKNTLVELQRELMTLLPKLGIQCCFLLLYAEPRQQFAGLVRLFFAYDAFDPDLSHIFPQEFFDSRQLLPLSLLSDGRLGAMCELTPLAIGTELYGYMIFTWSAHYFVDFLTMPIVISGALRHIHQLQSLQEYASALEQKVEERTQELRLINRRLQHEVQERRNGELALRAANEKLKRLASIDGLTQLENRTTLDEYLFEQCQQHPDQSMPLSLLLSDIDYFKKYNDTYGHQAGDACLRAVAHVFREIAAQHQGIAARYGGEEFALALPNCTEHAAMRVAEQIMAGIATLQIAHAASTVAAHVTCSIGIATIPAPHHMTTEELIAHADVALYTVKFKGRNGFACYHEQMMSSHQPSNLLPLLIPFAMNPETPSLCTVTDA